MTDTLRRKFMLGAMALGLVATTSLAVAIQPAAAADEVVIAAFAPPKTPWDNHWQALGKAIDASGDMSAKMLIRGELGQEPDMVAAVRKGRANIAGLSSVGLGPIVPELSLLSLPFMFESVEEVDFVYDNYLKPVLNDIFADKNMVVIAFAEVGWYHVVGKEPIMTPDDIKGLKIRIPANKVQQEFLTSVGANPVNIPPAELNAAFQTGLVDGGLYGNILHAILGLKKTAPHVSQIKHSYVSGFYIANKAWWEGLSDAQRAVIIDGLPEQAVLRSDVRNMAAGMVAQAKTEGVEYHEVTDEQLAAWREATKDVAPAMIADIGGRSQEFYDAMVAGIEAYRNQ